LINQDLTKKQIKVYELILDLKKNNKPVSASIIKSLLTGKDNIDVRLLAYFQTT
jgi:hypothetical protein